MRIEDLPKFDRPREKMARYGPTRLTSAELLAVILGSGSNGLNAVELARKVLLKYGQQLSTVDYESLTRLHGIGPGRAASLVAAFELSRRFAAQSEPIMLPNAKEIWLALADIRSLKKEYCIAFYLDSRQQLIERLTISVGTVNASLVHPREVFEPALRSLSSQLIIAHNHPSGNLEPSSDDVIMTARLVEAGQILGISIADHVIVGSRSYFSFRENGLL